MRKPYDLTHFCITSGDFGRLQTLAVIPTLPGDSFELQAHGMFRMSALRRLMVVDAHLDFFGFWIPHRHIYGDDWIDWVKGGIHSPVHTTATDPWLPSPTPLTTNNAGSFACNRKFNDLPAWIPGGYIQIWNRYFRSPTWPIGTTVATQATLNDIDDASYKWWKIYEDAYGGLDSKVFERDLKLGLICGRIKRPWSTAVKVIPAVTDRQVDVTASKFDIIDLNKVKAQYKTEVDRDWFGVRYNDLLEKVWHTHVNIDADQRPELLFRETGFMSGKDIDGTADTNLGQFQGKSATPLKFGFKRKTFNEHGALWIMCLPRFPALQYDEINPLTGYQNPTYKQFSGDPSLFAVEPPIDCDHTNWFANGTAGNYGFIPYGQEYRTWPSYISNTYSEVQGYPFVTSTHPVATPMGGNYMMYHGDSEYAEVFQTNQINQWQAHVRMDMTAHRNLSGPTTSMYAGA